jgi:hypothetical protein
VLLITQVLPQLLRQKLMVVAYKTGDLSSVLAVRILLKKIFPGART